MPLSFIHNPPPIFITVRHLTLAISWLDELATQAYYDIHEAAKCLDNLKEKPMQCDSVKYSVLRVRKVYLEKQEP